MNYKGLSDAAIRRLAQASWGDLAQYGYDPKEMDTTLSQAVQLLTQARELLTPYVSQGAGGGALDSIVNQLDNATLGLTNLGSEDSPMAWAGESSGLVAKKATQDTEIWDLVDRAREFLGDAEFIEGLILAMSDEEARENVEYIIQMNEIPLTDEGEVQ